MAVDFYQLRVQGLHRTEYNECVLHFRGTNLTAADYVANAADLVSTFDIEIKSAWLAMLPASYQLLRLTAKKASAGGGAEVSSQYQFGDAPGAVAGGAASQQLCPAIILIPPMGTKTAGKFWLPAVAESQIAANVVSAGWLSNLVTLMSQMTSGVSADVIIWDLSVFSRKNQSFAEVVDYSVSPIVGFQRRRQRAPL